MTISVVLPVYISCQKNITDTLKCISLLRSNTKIPFELVIVETCSKNFINMADVFIYEKQRTCPNRSVSRGFDACRSDYVVFVGNDVFVDDGWLEALIEPFEGVRKKEDCGISTLGNSEHKDIKEDAIEEGIYFSICMLRKKDAKFDEFYRFVFDDTDLIFSIYASGRKCYKNLNCIVQHHPHTTLGEFGGNKVEYERSREYFKNKWKEYTTLPLYKTFVCQ